MKINPAAAGMDEGRLARITEHLEERYIRPGKIAGCQTVVARHGEVAYFSSLGEMDHERAKPVADDTIWRIYSMTKPITGVALMTLYEQGRFQLDDEVSRFIPQWRDLKVREKADDGTARLVDPQRPMTVRDLLMHMSGLGFGLMRPQAGDDDTTLGDVSEVGRPGSFFDSGATLESMVDYLAERPLRFHPGTRWFYSVSTDICGRLVEIISGQRFDEYLKINLFDRLGMTDTGFHVPDDKVDRFAANYRRNAKKDLVLLEDPEVSGYRTPRSFLSGGGGLVSTTSDYLRFCQMMLNGGELDGVRILGRKTVELMSSNHLPGGGELRQFALPNGYGEVGFDGMGFGHTMSVSHGPVQTQMIGSPGEYMWGGAASTAFWIDPVEDLTVVFMTQLMPSGTFDFRGQLKTIIYPAIVD